MLYKHENLRIDSLIRIIVIVVLQSSYATLGSAQTLKVINMEQAVLGSNFFRNLQRDVRPFESYIQSISGNARVFSIDTETTGIEEICIEQSGHFKVYNASGQCVMTIKSIDELTKGHRLRAGVYFVNGKKMILK